MPNIRSNRILVGSVSVNPASLAANTTANTDLTSANADFIAQLSTAHKVVAVPQGAIEQGLVCIAAYCPTDGTLRLRIHNATAGVIDGAAFTWAVFAWLER